MNTPKAVIVGAGIAGLTAAFELQKRGFEITIIEKGDDESFGGKLSTHPCDQCGGRHEHTHHIFLNWYHNFWRLTQELDLDIDELFEPRETVNALRSIENSPQGSSLEDRLTQRTNEGSLAYLWKNIMDGPESPANMFLYGYSLLDLISKPYRRKGILDNYSVNGFMRSRWYATPEAAKLHQRYLNVAFADPSFQTSGETYKKFIAFSAWDPVPQYYLMKQGVRATMIAELRRRLTTGDSQEGLHPARILTGHTVTKIVLEEHSPGTRASPRSIDRITVSESTQVNSEPKEFDLQVGKGVFLILAVSLDGLHQLVDEEFYEATPNLQRVHSLRSATISSLELNYASRVDGIPKEHTDLLNSAHELSFLDASQISPPAGKSTSKGTSLSVSISEFDALDSWDQNNHLPGTNWDRAKRKRRQSPDLAESAAKWDRVKKMIFRELKGFLPNLPVPGKSGSMCLVRNTGARLFLNDVHDWTWQPSVACEGISNLFLAGEFVQNPIDAVTVESAVVTGLQAAEAVRSQVSIGERIEILEPETYPVELIQGAVQMLVPYAFAAKAWTLYEDARSDPVGSLERGIDLWAKASRSFWNALRQR